MLLQTILGTFCDDWCDHFSLENILWIPFVWEQSLHACRYRFYNLKFKILEECYRLRTPKFCANSQLNLLFYICTYLVNRIGMRQSTAWFGHLFLYLYFEWKWKDHLVDNSNTCSRNNIAEINMLLFCGSILLTFARILHLMTNTNKLHTHIFNAIEIHECHP